MKKTINCSALEKEVVGMRNSLKSDRLDMSFGEVMATYDRDELLISPDFQRLFRWDLSQRTKFIESILLGIPIPAIFVAEDRNGRWELVDGLQRVSTILSFFGVLKNHFPENKNNWVLQEANLLPSLEGFSAKTLPQKYLLNIKRAVCRIEIIKWDGVEPLDKVQYEDELRDLLAKRNCIAHGNHGIEIEAAQLEQYASLVDRLMNDICEKLSDGLKQKVYLKNALCDYQS